MFIIDRNGTLVIKCVFVSKFVGMVDQTMWSRTGFFSFHVLQSMLFLFQKADKDFDEKAFLIPNRRKSMPEGLLLILNSKSLY